MRFKLGTFLSTPILFAAAAMAQTAALDSPSKISLTVPAGVPLRLYLTKRISKKTGAPVEAKVLEPVYAFDHEVIPAGATVLGHVDKLESISKWQRTRAILGGDFTPLHIAPVEFDKVMLPDGRQIELHTAATPGLNTIVPLHPPKKRQSPADQNAGILGTGKQQAKDAIQAKMDQIRSIPDMVRGPGKTEIVENYLFSKLPYHPQYVRSRTRFDAVLEQPLDFGQEAVSPQSLALLGTDPPADTVAHARLLTPLDSATAKPGEKIEAVLSEPVFSSDHKLILPEGTHVGGTVVIAKKSKWLHRSGQLRFNFQNFTLPDEAVALENEGSKRPGDLTFTPVPAEEKKLEHRTQATLAAAEGTGKTPVKVDSEGGVKAQESKSRFVLAAVSVLVASRAGDVDGDKLHGGAGATNAAGDANVGGRTMGGGLGLGMIGSGLAQTSPYVGMALGYYGMAWSVYATILAPGPEVQFDKNAVVEIRFNTRTPAGATQFQASGN